MKKFLSLVLALVMTMSLVTISAGAEDFTDDSTITYAEAVDVMSAIGVVGGYADGSFNPTAGLTRGAAAKIICNLILGPTTASALSADTAPYSDVPVSNTFAGYIAYCAQQGIISGYADGTFKPAAPLTGYAFMKMLLGALGYDAEIEGYVGANWSVQVAKQALAIGLNAGLDDEFNGAKALNREEACLYAFNTLQATMVDYEARTSVSVGGADVVIAGSKAENVEQGSYNNTMSKAYLQFAEKYFGKLTLSEGRDAFARPATTWRYKGDKVGTYADTADLTYEKNTKLGTIYADLGMTEKDSIVEVYVNGVQQDDVAVAKNNTYSIAQYQADGVTNYHNGGLVGDGSTVEVFYDADNNDVTIIVIDTYVGSVQKTVDATSAKDAYIVIDESATAPANWTGNDTYETEEVFADDVVVLYTFSQKEQAIQSVEVAESVTGVLNKIVSGKNLTLGDTVYPYAIQKAYDSTIVNEGNLNTGSEYTFYTDVYGNVIYVVEEEYISSDYAMIVAIEQATAGFTVNRVKLLTAEGVEAIYTTDKNYMGSTYRYGASDIVTYKVKDNGTVALKKVASQIDNMQTTGSNPDAIVWDSTTNGSTAFNLDMGVAKIDIDTMNDRYANSKTVFVVRDANGDYAAYTGIKNVPSITPNGGTVTMAAYCKTGSMVTVMFIDASNASIVSSSADVIYLAGKSASAMTTDLDNTYYTFNAVVKGELTTVTVENNAATRADGVFASATTVNKYNQVFAGATYNSDGIITDFTAISGSVATNSTTSGAQASGTTKLSGEYTIQLASVPFTVDEDANIWTIDNDGVIAAATLSDIKTDASNLSVYTVEDGMITNLFVQLPAATNPVAPGVAAVAANVTNITYAGTTLTVTLGTSTTATVPVTIYQVNGGALVELMTVNVPVTASVTGTATVGTLPAGSTYLAKCGTLTFGL